MAADFCVRKKNKMKKCLIIVYLLLQAFCILEANEIDVSREDILGANIFDFIFIDKNLTKDEKHTIVKDIKRVLSTSSSFLELEHLKDLKKRKNGIEGRINTGVKGHYWPRPFWKLGFGGYRFNKSTSKYELIIPKELSGVYLKAIEFIKRNSGVFEELTTFLLKIEQGFNPAEMNLVEKKNLFWVPPGHRKLGEEKYYDKNIYALKNLLFLKPSILNFAETTLKGEHLLFCEIIVMEKMGDFMEKISVVYSEKSWHLLDSSGGE